MNFQTAIASAQGRWHDILSRLDIDSKYLSGRHGPCPVCGGKDRFRFDDKNGKGGWICSACGAGDGFALVSRIKRITLVEAKDLVLPLIPSAGIKKQREVLTPDKARARSIDFWKSCRTDLSEADVVARYQMIRLGEYVPSPAIGEAYAPHPSDRNRSFHIMAAMISDPSGSNVSVHRTYLLPDGNKANQLNPAKILMQGSIPPGSAIRLFKPESHLGIAEGIETALAAYLMTGIPTWSAINAPIMKGFDPPKGVKRLTIFSDNDANYVGQSAAYELARRLTMSKGIRVEVRVPPAVDTDWADIWSKQHGTPLENNL